MTSLKMNDDFWKAKLTIERRYFNGINQFKTKLNKILKTYSSLSDILQGINDYTESQEFQAIAHGEALRMVESTVVTNARTWKEAARKSTKGRQIYELLRDETSQSKVFQGIVKENASLIKSVPPYVSEKITKYITQETIKGRRPEEIAKEIRQYAPELSENRAKLIARTEVSKAQTAIIQSRAERLSMNYYTWDGAMDQRERPSHKIMQGVICDFRNPPAPEAILGIKSTLGHYHAGNCPNCRCSPVPVLDRDDAENKANKRNGRLKIVQGNSIVSISKAEFLRLF